MIIREVYLYYSWLLDREDYLYLFLIIRYRSLLVFIHDNWTEKATCIYSWLLDREGYLYLFMIIR